MSSILTNNSAMVALQTLQSVNSNLAKTQDMISTGKEVGSAKDNSAVFAISKVMESDISGSRQSPTACRSARRRSLWRQRLPNRSSRNSKTSRN